MARHFADTLTRCKVEFQISHLQIQKPLYCQLDWFLHVIIDPLNPPAVKVNQEEPEQPAAISNELIQPLNHVIGGESPSHLST